MLLAPKLVAADPLSSVRFMVRRWDLHGLVPCLCCSYHRCLRSGEFVRLIGEVHKTFLNHYCFINVCIHTCFLWVCVCVCKLVSCSHSILLEQIAETFSADLIFLFSPGHQGMIHKSLDKFTRYIFFYPCSFAIYLTLNFGFQSPIFPFCRPNRLQVGWCYQSQHLSRWRS